MKRSLVALVAGLLLSACSAAEGSGDESSEGGAPAVASGTSDAGVEIASGADAAVPRACPVAPSTDPLVVAIDKGLVKGTQAGNGFAFLGIPFAKPPTGKLRFMPPVAPDCWSDVVDATHFGEVCAQINASNGGVLGSEDCLSVNVWTPALPTPSSKPLPVLFWIYGGGDITGGSNYPGTSGQELANARNAVVVSFNYRVGALGFLGHPALRDANPQHTTGNYGLLDALLALQWVQDNIASFGGDKTRVMIFGQSAGAINTCALVSSPLGKGLFSSALMESGNCAGESLDYRYSHGAIVATSVNCTLTRDVVGCLQNAPLSTLVLNAGLTFAGSAVTQVLTTSFDGGHISNLPFGPTVDGYVLEATPQATLKAGKHNHVPLVIGSNAREMGFLIPPGLVPAIPIASCAEYATLVTAMFPLYAIPLLTRYPCNPLDPGAGYRQLVNVASDGFFTCPSRRALRSAAATQTEPVYRYVFTHGDPIHTAEIAYVFNSLAATSSPAETLLSKQIQSYWANLAGSGNPNGAGLPNWTAYDPKADNALVLDTPIGETAGFQAAGCDFWDTVQ